MDNAGGKDKESKLPAPFFFFVLHVKKTLKTAVRSSRYVAYCLLPGCHACRGREFDLPVTGMAGDSDEEEEQVVADDGVFHTLPAGADFLMCYSVAKGYFSFRDPINGSWYIQDLCKTLEGYGGSREFTELLTLVNSKVCKRSVEKSRIPDAIGKKQIPCFASMLTKNLFFRPKR
ncbi:unnamed protein product [Boreogadus saida]